MEDYELDFHDLLWMDTQENTYQFLEILPRGEVAVVEYVEALPLEEEEEPDGPIFWSDYL